MSAFATASAVVKDGEGRYTATLSPQWAAGTRAHGGYLLAIMARAALACAQDSGALAAADPLAVSAQFLRAPAFGPAVVRTAVRRAGRTVTVVTATLEQDGQPCVDATVTCGTLPVGPARWLQPSQLPGEPPADAIDVGTLPGSVFRVAEVCPMRLDRASAGFVAGRTDLPPRTRIWLRPPAQGTGPAEAPDPLFALVAGDISPPVVFNLGALGWAPTVQLTALLRARPVPGWLRVQAEAVAVYDPWFDEDHAVFDAAGQLVCQARQLALRAL